MVITIGREFGSGGKYIGEKLAEELGIKIYDKEILIQWENAAPIPDKGLSVTINKTLQIIPNKVVFGWPLTEEIT